METWSVVREFPSYSVSDHGRVRNDNTERMMTAFPTRGGHLHVGMVRHGVQFKRGLAKIVSEHYLIQPEPHFNTPIHLDGDLSNCHVSNLTWRPRWFAQQFSRQFNLIWRPYPPVRDLLDGMIHVNIWDLVMERGLLLSQIIHSADEGSFVFPTHDRFAWV